MKTLLPSTRKHKRIDHRPFYIKSFKETKHALILTVVAAIRMNLLNQSFEIPVSKTENVTFPHWLNVSRPTLFLTLLIHRTINPIVSIFIDMHTHLNEQRHSVLLNSRLP